MIVCSHKYPMHPMAHQDISSSLCGVDLKAQGRLFGRKTIIPRGAILNYHSKGFASFPNESCPRHGHPFTPLSCQVLPDQDQSIFSLLLGMPTGDLWDDGEMLTVYRYVRGSKRLQLPAEFRPLLF